MTDLDSDATAHEATATEGEERVRMGIAKQFLSKAILPKAAANPRLPKTKHH